MLKQSISLALLCFAGHAIAADIVVNTTSDVVANDDKCSLREAIEYINQGRPEAGLNGCGGKESSNTIYLESKTYNLNSQIHISKPVIFRTRYEATTDHRVVGQYNAVIQMSGKDRLFYVDRQADKTKTLDDDNTPIEVSFNEITLKGCGTSVCAEDGGLIYNKENLKFESSVLLSGSAKRGGAIFSLGKFDPVKRAGLIEINNSILQSNTAEQGGVIYGETPQFLIYNSIIKENTATSNNGSLFDHTSGFDSETIKTLNGKRGIANSTIYNNNGHTMRVMDMMTINNVTMVKNSKGLIIDAPHNRGIVANSILVSNGTQDCTIQNGGLAAQLSNNLYSSGCAGTASTSMGSINLLAGAQVEGTCDITSTGILCPYKDYKKFELGYFRPRLLESYTTLNDSPIVNKGPRATDNITECEATDQRGQSRGKWELCDRGAVELRVDATSIDLVGDDILYKEVAKMSITDQLVDGELITPAQCQILFGQAPNNTAWQPGCLRVIQNPGIPSKGKLSITQDGDISYQPNGEWHGSDEFTIEVVTTTTYFSDSLNKHIRIKARVVQDPPNNFQDYSVKTSGGSFGMLSIAMLAGLLLLRRRVK